jgi:hypothetical protein
VVALYPTLPSAPWQDYPTTRTVCDCLPTAEATSQLTVLVPAHPKYEIKTKERFGTGLFKSLFAFCHLNLIRGKRGPTLKSRFCWKGGGLWDLLA